MDQSADNTPIERPLMLSDIRAIRIAVQNTETIQIKMYEELKGYRKRIGYPVAVCVVSAMLCLGSVFARFVP